jgi:RNA polymerase sigma factor (TIGR02999 family)
MPETPPSDITGLLHAWTRGQTDALNRLVEITYPELHEIARRYFQRERSGHTLQCTALINEAYLRLIRTPEKQWNSRAHFFGFAARVMRGILVDHARARQTAKRGGGALTVTIQDSESPSRQPEVDVLDLNSALDELARLDDVQSRIVELRYFGGLTIEETVEATGLSATTVKREWVLAKTWIRRRLVEGNDGHAG